MVIALAMFAATVMMDADTCRQIPGSRPAMCAAETMPPPTRFPAGAINTVALANQVIDLCRHVAQAIERSGDVDNTAAIVDIFNRLGSRDANAMCAAYLQGVQDDRNGTIAR